MTKEGEKDADDVIHGFAYLKSVGTKLNYGTTSIGSCGNTPWHFRCLLTFPHELAHSLGASDYIHRENELEEDGSTYLMGQHNQMDQEITANTMVREFPIYCRSVSISS